ncbi:helix-turn-helix transcriptional regulator [Brevundimonas sp. AJA228-03]|jgi:AcrR family transcriptional regulator|uniref:TetR/AcrR family transcriptional regulator n=1 Tax=Brevundimonas sp. AJA228-03 TaxID=2752515 RepID=UPI001ADF2400|nr:helix-turn-helix domain-containing protein [Brevundimonas sp. AJA228-03]QTN18391.1 helix-turn-helix transcriptional regulator [Brevundimonas sp. AJA228-03]
MSVLNKSAASVPKSSIRRDVIRHRAALLDAATEVFAKDGIEAPLVEIARRAGVGRGTLYRHFPERIDLVVALLERNLDELQAQAADLADQPEGLLALIRTMINQDVDVAPLLDSDLIVPAPLLARFVAICRRPLEAARRSGVVRQDLDETDLLDLTVMAGSALRRWGLEERRVRAPRILTLLLEGIRSDADGKSLDSDQPG